jgi:hypothetical protein
MLLCSFDEKGKYSHRLDGKEDYNIIVSTSHGKLCVFLLLQVNHGFKLNIYSTISIPNN